MSKSRKNLATGLQRFNEVSEAVEQCVHHSDRLLAWAHRPPISAYEKARRDKHKLPDLPDGRP